MIDFDRHRPLSSGNGRFQPSATDFGRYQPREGERRRGEEKGEPGVRCCSPDPSPAGDFFSPREEKKHLPHGERERGGPHEPPLSFPYRTQKPPEPPLSSTTATSSPPTVHHRP
ncbi:hypothetical protein BHM03_00016303 [Ensete ventricosum]|nr:hypothetical protein BHM03_00016303 [Ensete ventricosum]